MPRRRAPGTRRSSRRRRAPAQAWPEAVGGLDRGRLGAGRTAVLRAISMGHGSSLPGACRPGTEPPCYDTYIRGLMSDCTRRAHDRSAMTASAPSHRQPDRGAAPTGAAATTATPPPVARRRHKVIAVMPAYNAERTLAATLADIPAGCVDEVHPGRRRQHGPHGGARPRDGPDGDRPSARTAGYGGNQKTCYRAALDARRRHRRHDPPRLPVRQPGRSPTRSASSSSGICDVVLGSRIRSRAEALRGGMPIYKYLANRFLTLTENLLLGQNLGDFHSGFRVYPARGAGEDSLRAELGRLRLRHPVPGAGRPLGFRLGDMPVPVRYFDEARSINFRRSVVYGMGTLAMLGVFWLDRLGIKRSRLFEPGA